MKFSDVRQSEEFSSFMREINWKAEKISGSYVYLKKFFPLGFFAKCPRPVNPVNIGSLRNLIERKKIFRFKISPFLTQNQKEYTVIKKSYLTAGFQIDKDPFNPTTTIQIDLKGDEKEIFRSFSEAKRRGIRRAIKHNVTVDLSDDLEAFIKIRKHQYRPMGFLIAGEMKKLWKNFFPKKADLLLAKSKSGKFIAGIMLLYQGKTAYYWFASATNEGKKLFAPTLLVWKAVKTAKKRGCDNLDFEGIYDERFPKASAAWRGFTKFKEGFSDKKIIFMENLYLKTSPLNPALRQAGNPMD